MILVRRAVPDGFLIELYALAIRPAEDHCAQPTVPHGECLHPELSWQTVYTNPWPHFRLAEIYLNYAEAKFELGNEATAREYLSMVRARVGMPPVPASVSGSALRQRIYNERRIELAFEGHRFFDIRRWLIAGDIENRPIRGMEIVRNIETGERKYTPVELLVKAPYAARMNLLPVAAEEFRRNPKLTQTPGW